MSLMNPETEEYWELRVVSAEVGYMASMVDPLGPEKRIPYIQLVYGTRKAFEEVVRQLHEGDHLTLDIGHLRGSYRKAVHGIRINAEDWGVETEAMDLVRCQDFVKVYKSARLWFLRIKGPDKECFLSVMKSGEIRKRSFV